MSYSLTTTGIKYFVAVMIIAMICAVYPGMAFSGPLDDAEGIVAAAEAAVAPPFPGEGDVEEIVAALDTYLSASASLNDLHFSGEISHDEYTPFRERLDQVWDAIEARRAALAPAVAEDLVEDAEAAVADPFPSEGTWEEVEAAENKHRLATYFVGVLPINDPLRAALYDRLDAVWDKIDARRSAFNGDSPDEEEKKDPALKKTALPKTAAAFPWLVIFGGVLTLAGSAMAVRKRGQ